MEDWEREVWCLNVKYEEKAGLLLGLVPEWLLVHSSKNSVTNSDVRLIPIIHKDVPKMDEDSQKIGFSLFIPNQEKIPPFLNLDAMVGNTASSKKEVYTT